MKTVEPTGSERNNPGLALKMKSCFSHFYTLSVDCSPFLCVCNEKNAIFAPRKKIRNN